MPLPVHEEKLIKAFFLKERQEPYLLGLANPGKRRKITNEFCHFKHLDLRFNVSILPSQQNPAAIYDLLKKFGAPDVCWVVSDELELDAHNYEPEGSSGPNCWPDICNVFVLYRR